MMKGQFSFFLKSLMLLAAVISLIVVAILSHNFTRSVEKQREEAEIIQSADDVINQLISKKCLGYEFQGSGIQPVLDKDKLDEFQSRYIDVEPDCARSFDFDYSVEVRTIPYNFSLYPFINYTPVDLMLALDKSGSMNCCNSSTYSGGDMYAVCCGENSTGYDPEDALGDQKWIENLQGAIDFINQLNKEDKVGLILFSSSIDRTYATPTTNHNRIINRLNNLKHKKPTGGTHIGETLATIRNNYTNVKVVVLLSDGCSSSDDTNPLIEAENSAKNNITIFTIGYTIDVKACNPKIQAIKDMTGEEVLMKIANITGGKYFYSPGPENLSNIYKEISKLIPRAVKPKENITASVINWSFGIFNFSFKNDRFLDYKISVPATVRFNDTHYLPAILSIHVVKGNLEMLKNAIEKVCELGKATNQTSYSFKFQTNYPIVMNNGYLCLKSRPEICKRISCDYPVEFENIDKPGLYFIRIKLENNKVRVNT